MAIERSCPWISLTASPVIVNATPSPRSSRRTSAALAIVSISSFWLLVPGTIGLIGITELVGENPEAGLQNLGTALVAIPAVALGILVGTMVVRAVRIATRTHIVRRRPSLPRP